jgi:hypothetical protein
LTVIGSRTEALPAFLKSPTSSFLLGIGADDGQTGGGEHGFLNGDVVELLITVDEASSFFELTRNE